MMSKNIPSILRNIYNQYCILFPKELLESDSIANIHGSDIWLDPLPATQADHRTISSEPRAAESTQRGVTTIRQHVKQDAPHLGEITLTGNLDRLFNLSIF